MKKERLVWVLSAIAIAIYGYGLFYPPSKEQAIAPSPSPSPTPSIPRVDPSKAKQDYLKEVRANMPPLPDGMRVTDDTLVNSGWKYCADAASSDPEKLRKSIEIALRDSLWTVEAIAAFTHLCPKHQDKYEEALKANGVDARDPSNDAQ